MLRRVALIAAGCAGLLLLTLAAAAVFLLRVPEEATPPAEPGRHTVQVVETRPIVPGPGLPDGLALGASNNNLDAVRHGDGFVYLAFRTAPHHFANTETRIVVVRSRDELSWELDHEFALGHDLREPRLLSHGDRLVLFVSKLGSDPLAFEPAGMVRAVRETGRWSELAPFGAERTIGWRARTIEGTPALIAYQGGGTAYGAEETRMRIDLFRSDDGLDWRPWDPEHGPLYEGGGGEADFARSADGDYFGTVRVESGDDRGFGSRVCRAPAAHPARWRCRPDPRKYDSPFVFAHDGEVYLLGRRNLRGDGRVDQGVGPSSGRLQILRVAWNHLNYSLARKRCALWRFVPDPEADDGVGLRLAFVLDLPSRGDTCFAAVLSGRRPEERIVYDYSNPLDGPDPRWIEGQRGETRIHRHVLRFRRH
ncbi:MAG: hypothetical protein JRH10_19920 [Deltaproteobacteria bacterium]|nr:hypothetical protein [Deltaproteobacteria bacterium]MBW2446125.1 hypothetical protein [Deltaproteobacteria bacterium]